MFLHTTGYQTTTILQHKIIRWVSSKLKRNGAYCCSFYSIIQSFRLSSEEQVVRIKITGNLSSKLEFVFLLFQTRPSIHGGAAHEIRRRPVFDRRRGLQLRSSGCPVWPHLHRGLPYRQRTGRRDQHCSLFVRESIMLQCIK